MEAKQKVVGYIKQTLRHKSSSIARKNETYPHAPQPKKKKEKKKNNIPQSSRKPQPEIKTTKKKEEGVSDPAPPH